MLKRFAILLVGAWSLGLGTATALRADVRDLESEWLESVSSSALTRVPGISGMAWEMSDAQEPIQLTKGADLSGDFTLTTWFRLDDPLGRSTVWSSRAYRHFLLMIGGGDCVEINYVDGGTDRSTDSAEFSYDFKTGLWYQLVMTGDSESGLRFYVNGEAVFDLPAFTDEVERGDITLACLGAYSVNHKGDFDHFFKGALDKPELYSRTLSPEEVKQQYKDAIRTVPVIPIPMQSHFASEDPLPRTNATPELRLNTDLVPGDDPGVAKLKEALPGARLSGDIVISSADDVSLPAHVKALLSEGIPDEGYVLSIRPGRIDLVGESGRGIFYGTDTLVQLLSLGSIPQVDIFDYPEFAYRAGMYLLDSRPPSSLDSRYGKLSLKKAIEYYAHGRMNMIMLRLYNYAWLDDPEALKLTREIHDYAKKYHLDVIPYMQFYGHAKFLLYRDMRTGHTRTVYDETQVLKGTEVTNLNENNVIITSLTPVEVSLENGSTMTEGEDFEVIHGELNTSWYPPKGVKVPWRTWTRPYLHPDNAPFGIRRLPGGNIPDGAKVAVTYDVASQGEGSNPYSPVTRELTEDIIRTVIDEFDPEYIHFGVDEIWEPLSTESRSFVEGTTQVEAMEFEMNETYSIAQDAKPGVKVMYWSDMFDANQTPAWYATWEGVHEMVTEGIDKNMVITPWYYGDSLARQWRVPNSMDYFLEKGFTTLGSSGHEPLNQFLWSQATLSRMGRYPTNGYTFTIWSGWGTLPVLEDSLLNNAQTMWSPSRMPFQSLVNLRFELNALGITPDMEASALAKHKQGITDYYKGLIAQLYRESLVELAMTDEAILRHVKLSGVQDMLAGLSQAKEIIRGGNNLIYNN